MVTGLGGPGDGANNGASDGAGNGTAGNGTADDEAKGGRSGRDVLRPAADLVRRRGRRQAWTFAALVTIVLGAGLVAGGHWLQWWTLGDGSAGGGRVPCPQQRAIDPTQVTVHVHNGTGRAGLARAVATELQARGFRVATITTDTSGQVVAGVAALRHGPVGKLGAQTVAAQLVGQFTVEDDGRRDRTVDLIIGPEYRTLKPRPEASAAIAPVPTPLGCRPVPNPA